MFEWKIETEHTFQCPPVHNAVGVWRDKQDYIFAYNDNDIFAIRVEDLLVIFLEKLQNFSCVDFPVWQELLPSICSSIVASDICSQLCVNELGRHYIVSKDPKMFFSPKSCQFDIGNVCGAVFLHLIDGSRVVFLTAEKIFVTKCIDWWQDNELESCADIANDQEYIKLISNHRQFVAYGEKIVTGFDKASKQLWQHKFEQNIVCVWYLESGFQLALLFDSGDLILIDQVDGKLLMDKPMSPSIQLFATTHVVMKNSTNSNGNRFYVVTQKKETNEDGKCETTICQIRAQRIETDFVQPQRQIVPKEK